MVLMPRVLMYHDVVDGDFDTSGFPGGGPAHYKLRIDEFERHLTVIGSLPKRPTLLSRVDDSGKADSDAVLITFDDGGISAATIIADALERRGWRGHFFITADYIGKNGFVSASQIRDLAQRGHIIGTHSCSHPSRMSSCTQRELMYEWQRSREVLSEIVASPITVASVPGGYYSRDVATAAAASGLSDLFTSEPTTRVSNVNGLRVYGRFSIHRGTSTAKVAAISSGAPYALMKEAALWKLKKVLKFAGGGMYLRMRRLILNRQHGFS